MKKRLAILALIVVSSMVFCKKEHTEQPQDVTLTKKYAKYRVAVRKEVELKNWVATLEKGEDVDLLNEQEVFDQSGKKITVAKVRLADGTEGFVDSGHLADKVIVFIEDTPVFTRPTVASKIHCKVPKGTMAFVVGEQANWVKIYVGKINDVWVTEQWVQGGYSSDEKILITARMYEMALEQLASTKEAERNAGKQKLIEISEGDSIFAALASQKLDALASQQAESQEKTSREDVGLK